MGDPDGPSAVTGLHPGAQGPRISAERASAAIGCVSGMVAGLVVGGVGGRIAMRVLFLTTGEHVRGVVSDDQFMIGRFSSETIFLLVVTTFLGAVGGFLYGLLRRFTAGPIALVAVGVGVATATGVGAVIVHPDGVDFTLLEPLWLAVGLFVLLPGVWGVTVVVLTERLLRWRRLFRRPLAGINQRRWGALGWIALGTFTTLGVVDLAQDLARLT